jgi:hypothetical protein
MKMTAGAPWLAKYMKQQGQSLAQYETVIRNANAVADRIVTAAAERHKRDTGMYYPAAELGLTDSCEHNFVRVCLKDRGMEFIENGAFYRL